MLEIAGVTQHIELFATVEDAVNSFQRSKQIK
jgi:hypothetical protein